jgi:hypothetical protein
VFKKRREIEEKAKRLLALNKPSFTMPEKHLLLCWRLGEEGYAPQSMKKTAD